VRSTPRFVGMRYSRPRSVPVGLARSEVTTTSAAPVVAVASARPTYSMVRVSSPAS